MDLSASLFDDPVSPDGDNRRNVIDCAAVRASLENDGIALTPPLLSEAECREIWGWFADAARVGDKWTLLVITALQNGIFRPPGGTRARPARRAWRAVRREPPGTRAPGRLSRRRR